MLNHKKNALSILLAVVGIGGVFSANAASLAINPAASTVGLTGGATTPAALTVNFTGDAAAGPTAVIGYQTDIAFDNTQMSVALANGNADSCVLFSPGVIRIQDVDPALTLLGSGVACTLTFTVNSPQTAGTVYNLTFTAGATLCSNASAGSETCGTNNGTITVVAGPQPALSSTPAPASTITINDIIGGGATTGALTITNSGQVGSTLNIGAATGLSGVLSIAPATAQTAVQGGPGVAYTISCAAVAAGTTSQVLSFTHDGTSPASPVTYNVDCVGVTGPTAPTASLGAVVQPPVGPTNTVGTGSVPVNVDSAGVATASLALNCSIPATGASAFTITGGATRTITAPATVGANAPDIGVSCVRQLAAVNATLTCTQTANPAPNPADLTATVTCPAGVPSAVAAVNPASIVIVGAPSIVASGSTTLTNSGDAALNVTSCAIPVGFTLDAPVIPATVAAGGSAAVTVSCTTPAAGAAPLVGDLVCQSNASNGGGVITIPLSCSGTPLVVPVMSNMGKILLASLVIGLGLLGMGLRRQG